MSEFGNQPLLPDPPFAPPLPLVLELEYLCYDPTSFTVLPSADIVLIGPGSPINTASFRAQMTCRSSDVACTSVRFSCRNPNDSYRKVSRFPSNHAYISRTKRILTIGTCLARVVYRVASKVGIQRHHKDYHEFWIRRVSQLFNGPPHVFDQHMYRMLLLSTIFL